jgi:uncharacterized protein (UPF0335 family)
MSDISCARCDAPAGHATLDELPAGWERHTLGSNGATIAVCPACLPSAGGRSIRDEGGNVADNQLRLFMERIERLEDEKKGISDDIRDTYAEAKAQGYDAKIMRQVHRLRRMPPHDRAEHQALLDTYLAALGLA